MWTNQPDCLRDTSSSSLAQEEMMKKSQ